MADAREVLMNVSEGERLKVRTTGGDEVTGVVQWTDRDEHRERTTVQLVEGGEHTYHLRVRERFPDEQPSVTRRMFMDDAARLGFISEDRVSDPQDVFTVDEGHNVVSVERLEVETEASEVHITERGERVEDLRDLNVGDEVLFDGRKRPLTVTEDTTMGGVSRWTDVALKGPQGGTVTVSDRERRPGGFPGWKTSSDGVVYDLIRVSEADTPRVNVDEVRRSHPSEPINHLSLRYRLREISEGGPAAADRGGLDQMTASEALRSDDPVAFLAAVARDPWRALDARNTAAELLSRHVLPDGDPTHGERVEHSITGEPFGQWSRHGGGHGMHWGVYRCPDCYEGEVLLTWPEDDTEEPEPRCPCGRPVPVPYYPGEDRHHDGERSDRGAARAGPRMG